MPPYISIIVPVYNAMRYLERCLESISGQTFKDFEIILVDDGSTDGCEGIYNKFVQRDSRFRLFKQPNAGVSAARNKGLANAQSEWICFVDADDALIPDALRVLTDNAASGDYDLVIGGYETFDKDGNRIYWIDQRTTLDLDRDAAVAQMFNPCYYRYLGLIAGKIFKASVIREHQIRFNPKIYFNEDRLFITQYLSFCSKVRYFTAPVYHYHEHPGSAMASLDTGFNERFITDFDAMVLIREAVANYSPINLKYASRDVAVSYWKIQGMMNQFHANTLQRALYLHKRLATVLTPKEYYEFVIQSFFRKISNRFRRTV